MKWIEPTVFAKSCGNPDFRSIFGHQRAKNAGTNTKIDRGPETYPISINPRDEMNWANSFREKLWKPCLQTDGRTDGQTDGQTSGWIQYTPFPPSVERGYNKLSIYIYAYIIHIAIYQTSYITQEIACMHCLQQVVCCIQMSSRAIIPAVSYISFIKLTSVSWQFYHIQPSTWGS